MKDEDYNKLPPVLYFLREHYISFEQRNWPKSIQQMELMIQQPQNQNNQAKIDFYESVLAQWELIRVKYESQHLNFWGDFIIKIVSKYHIKQQKLDKLEKQNKRRESSFAWQYLVFCVCVCVCVCVFVCLFFCVIALDFAQFRNSRKNKNVRNCAKQKKNKK